IGADERQVDRLEQQVVARDIDAVEARADLDRLGGPGGFLQPAQRAVHPARGPFGLDLLFLPPLLLLRAHQHPGEQPGADALDEVALAPRPAGNADVERYATRV